MNVDTHFSFPDQFWCECVVSSNRLCHFEYIDNLLDASHDEPLHGLSQCITNQLILHVRSWTLHPNSVISYIFWGIDSFNCKMDMFYRC